MLATTLDLNINSLTEIQTYCDNPWLYQIHFKSDYVFYSTTDEIYRRIQPEAFDFASKRPRSHLQPSPPPSDNDIAKSKPKAIIVSNGIFHWQCYKKFGRF